MAKITYPNKQVAIDPNAPAANELFIADDANEIKASVNAIYDTIANITLINGFVSGPNLVATSSTIVAIQTFTQSKALVYNANGFQYTIPSGTADQTFTGTPDATYTKACIIQGNGITISLKQGVADANVIYPTPDTGYVTIYSFLLTTIGITDISSQLAGYAKLNQLNTGDIDITGSYKKNGVNITFSTKLTITKTGANCINGAINLSSDGVTGIPLSIYCDVDGQQNNQISYNSITKSLFGGFNGTETLITIKITL